MSTPVPPTHARAHILNSWRVLALCAALVQGAGRALEDSLRGVAITCLGCQGPWTCVRVLLQALWGNILKTLESFGAIPGVCKTKFHVIFLISKMEILLFQSCCEKQLEIMFGKMVWKPQGVVQQRGGHGSGHRNLPATWPALPPLPVVGQGDHVTGL